MLNTKVDLIYINIKNEFYGSIYNKISLFITKKNLDLDLNNLSDLVKIRNKIAHGDTVSIQKINTSISYCELLALEMISSNFFNKSYSKISWFSQRL